MSESLDIIAATGLISDLPQFLVESTRQIVYRLKQAGMWHEDNDVRLYIPKKYLVDFAFLGYYLQEILSSDGVVIDDTRISVYQGLSDRFYLVVVKVGVHHLQEWDSVLERYSFRAPWAIAGFEVKE